MDKLKGLWRRGKQALFQKMGWSEKTMDDDFIAVNERYNQIVSHANSALRSIKQLQHSFTETIIHYKTLAESLEAAYEEGDRYELAANRLVKNVARLEDLTRPSLYEVIPSDCVTVLTEYVQLSEEVKKLINERKKKTLEFDFRRNKYNSTKDSKAEDKARRRIKLETARQEYEQANRTAIEAMVNYIERRAEFFDPFFDAVMTAVRGFNGNTLQQFEGIVPLMENAIANTTVRTDYLEVQRRKREAGDAGAAEDAGGAASSSSTSTATAATSSPAPAAPAQRFNAVHAQASPAAGGGNVDIEQGKSEFGDEFFYLDSGNAQKGPVRLADLRDLFQHGSVTEATFVFGHGMKDWQELREYPRLVAFLRS